MNNKILLLLAIALPLSIISCKKCYECEEYDYCMACTYSYNGVDEVLNTCYGTEHARDSAVTAFEETYENFNGYAICSKSQQKTALGDMKEICEGKKLAQEMADDLEFNGYICTEQ